MRKIARAMPGARRLYHNAQRPFLTLAAQSRDGMNALERENAALGLLLAAVEAERDLLRARLDEVRVQSEEHLLTIRRMHLEIIEGQQQILAAIRRDVDLPAET